MSHKRNWGTQMEPLQGTKTGQGAIQRVSYTHDAMIDLILREPMIKQGTIAQYFGYTEGWVSRVMGSDAFQARLASRKEELVNPEIRQTFEERLKGLANQSLQVIQDKLEATKSPELAIKALQLSTTALGFGARPQNIAQQNNFVVALPPKAENEQAWAQMAQAGAQEARRLAQGGPDPVVVDVEAKVA